MLQFVSIALMAASVAASMSSDAAPKPLDELQNLPALMQGTESWRFRLGVIVLPDFLADEHLASGKLMQSLPEYPIPEAVLFIARLPGDHPPRKVRVHPLPDRKNRPDVRRTPQQEISRSFRIEAGASCTTGGDTQRMFAVQDARPDS